MDSSDLQSSAFASFAISALQCSDSLSRMSHTALSRREANKDTDPQDMGTSCKVARFESWLLNLFGFTHACCVVLSCYLHACCNAVDS